MRARTSVRAALLRAGLAIATLGMGTAHAAALEAQAVVEDVLAELAPPGVAGGGWSALRSDALLGALCAPRFGSVLRIGLTTRPPSRWQRDACAAAAGAVLSDRVVGRWVLLAFGGKSAPPLTAGLLYRALAGRLPGAAGRLLPNQAARWHDLDPALPNVPIRVLLPPDGSLEARILAEAVLPEGCLAAAGAADPPGGPEAGTALCSDLRGDAVVTRAERGLGVAAWLRGAGPSAVALVGLETVVAEPELDTPLPLDGVSPRFATLADGSYKAMLPVHVLVLQAGVPDEAADAVLSLTSESAIGPGGLMAVHGLAPLPAVERVRLRGE